MKKIIVLISIGILVGCSDTRLDIVDHSMITSNSTYEKPDYNEDRNAYFGDTHVHTKYSFDAYIFGVTASPDDAYRYAQGESIKHPLGFDMQIDEPLDFYAVTDHGFFMGMLNGWADTSTYASTLPGAKPFHNLNRKENQTIDSAADRLGMFQVLVRDTLMEIRPWWDPTLWKAVLSKNISMGSANFDQDTHTSAWADITRAAEEANNPGKFTTFTAYEFTTSTDVENGNLHRNVIFKGSKIPLRPHSRIDSINPEDLWNWMDNLREMGIDSIAIPHNSNGSNGNMFEMETFEGKPITQDYAKQRMRNEPLVEMTQVKGTSDTHPLLSPNDEFADFEIYDYRIGSVPNAYSYPAGGYVREAYLKGMLLEYMSQGNPYKFGLIGASDSHTGAGAYKEDNYWSKIGIIDGTGETRGSIPLTGDQLNQTGSLGNLGVIYEGDEGSYIEAGFNQWGASGLAGVWAEENTRDSLFSAMRRKETFATSGNRMKVRFFGGFDTKDLDLDDENLVKAAYANSVTMGGEILADGAKVPSFLVWAQRDKKGAPLQRVQIIKGTLSNTDGKPSEEIYDVACSDGAAVDPTTNRCPDNGARVDIETCAFSKNVGSAELKAIWTDPDFNENNRSFYYVRVLENPTCRWSTWDAIRSGFKPREDLHSTIQERAWSSPIWYVPTGSNEMGPARSLIPES
ncbi:MAG: hypothetical protein CMC52_03110 [Flavobacteriaceae bacterium]|nr:hypothetical protein [Flavobacteriaceae bacterium]